MAKILTVEEKQGLAEQLELALPGVTGLIDDLSEARLREELDLVTPELFAGAIGVTVQTLAVWRGNAEGPDYIKPGRAVFYSRDTLKRWLDGQVTKPTKGTAIAA